MPELMYEDLDDLKRAKRLLESPGLAVRLTDALGRPIESVTRLLPGTSVERINRAVRRGLERAFDVALRTTDHNPVRPSADRLHKMAVAGSGAIGGLFGLPGLLVELPATTVLMMRSIADVARSEGGDLTDPLTRIRCLEVFALGGPAPDDDAAETGYFAVRAAMASAVGEAVRHVGARGMAVRGAPVLVRLADKLATRFGLVVQQKVALELFPLIGAATGAAVNTLFISHFQNVARGHFIVHRLEQTYGEDKVRAAYLDL